MRIVRGCSSVAAIVPMVGPFLLPVRRDDARFDGFRDRVLAYPLPPETRTKGTPEAAFGKITGGNGDY